MLLRWRGRELRLSGEKEDVWTEGGTHLGAFVLPQVGDAGGVWQALFLQPPRTLQLPLRVFATASPSTDGGNKEAKKGNTNWCVALLWQFVTEQSRIPRLVSVFVKVTPDLSGIKSNRYLAGGLAWAREASLLGYEVGRCPLANGGRSQILASLGLLEAVSFSFGQ